MEPDTAFENVKALLRRHNATPLAFKLVRKIREIENKPITEWGGWNLWELLVLIRWGFEHGGSDVLALPDPTDADVVNLMNAVKAMAAVADRWFTDNPTEAGLACGKCDSCKLRLKGFADANLTDPVEYVK